MSEQVTQIRSVSSRTLLHAVVRLSSEKHPAKIAEIQREIDRRAELRRAA
jgi:hypothetical protein